MPTLGVIFPPDLPPEDLRDVARAADEAGLEELWLWEDCFKESGIAAAAAVLGWTERLVVGVGLLPVPLRNVALTAMEIATLERLFPGRIKPGIGHGVLDWMGQVGARVESPMTLLREYTVALRALLHGERITTHGRYVQLDDVALDWPPSPPPPLLVGAVKPKTLALAGELGDGVILTGETSVVELQAALPYVRGKDVVVFIDIVGTRTPAEIAALIKKYEGATSAILLSVGDDRPALTDFVRLVADKVRPLV